MGLEKLTPEEKEKLIEQYLIILLGVVDRPIPSMLHLEKEFFILYRIAPKLSKIISFKKHYFGPYAPELKEALENPVEYEGAFMFNIGKITIFKNYLKFMETNIQLTSKGKKEFKQLLRILERNPKSKVFLAIAKSVRELYDKLTPEELLFLIYLTYPEYVEKSIIADILLSPKKRVEIAKKLYEKGLITKERYQEIIGKGEKNGST